MKYNFSKRDIKVFLLGVVTTIILVFISDWTNNINDVKNGFADGLSAHEKSTN